MCILCMYLAHCIMYMFHYQPLENSTRQYDELSNAYKHGLMSK
ncbi:unnamed protein product [Spodoptera exigua]|nr:unnamed protein product [Spodoptera exigua]